MDNVFHDLLQIIRQEGQYFNDTLLSIGIITSVSPLQVRYNDLVFDRSEILLADHLKERILPVTLMNASDQGEVIKDRENYVLWQTAAITQMKIPSALKVDDTVVVILREDKLWVLCKVV